MNSKPQPEESPEEILTSLSLQGRALALQGLKAARYAAEGPYGYLGGLVNMRVLDSGPDKNTSVLTMDVTLNSLNTYGYIHGGMLFTFADYAMGITARSLIGENSSTVTLEAKANYLSNIKEGQIIARCEALYQTEHLIVLETRIVNAADEKLIMIVTGTYYIIKKDQADKPE